MLEYFRMHLSLQIREKFPDVCRIDVSKSSEGFLPVRNTAGKWSFVEIDTYRMLDGTYDEVDRFINGVAPVCNGEKWGQLNSKGKELVNPKYLQKFWFKGQFAIVYEEDKEINRICKLINRRDCGIASGLRIGRTGKDIYTIQGRDGKKL